MDLNTRFVDALADIEQHLLATYPGDGRRRPDFRDAVSAAHRDGVLSERDVKDLDDLRPLRNLLAHSRWDGQPPVNAALSGVVRAEQLNEQLTGTVPRIDQFATGNGTVSTVSPADTVELALARMQEHDYSCLPVVDDDGAFRGLLSTHDLVCWLGPRLTTDGEVFDIPVAEVMHQGGPDHRFSRRDLPQRDARQAFIDHLTSKQTPLAAILITYTGHDHEPLLGILTPWDVPYLTP